jgi:uncharacterized protein
MVQVGQFNKLRVVRLARPGFYLDGEDLGEILLPNRYIPKDLKEGDSIEVFVYLDSEDRLVATTEKPRVMAGQCALLEVISSNRQLGAFLDWGMAKDLLLPMHEQARRVYTSDRVVAYVFIDEKSGRIVASTKLHRHLHKTPPPFTVGQRVRLLISQELPLGYEAIIENTHIGLLYRTDLGVNLDVGQRIDGFVRVIRPDGKIDLSLDLPGRGRVAPLAHRIVEALREEGGWMGFDDNSTPEAIRATFSASKKAFKQALGTLYREERIRFEDGGIRLVEKRVKGNQKP